jgi:glycosyltransferase involved in cell wall biosynthesis
LESRGHDILVVNMAAVPGIFQPSAKASTGSLVAPSRGTGRGGSPAPSFRHKWDTVAETLAMFTLRLLKSRHAAAIARYVESLKPDIVHQHSYLDGLGVSLHELLPATENGYYVPNGVDTNRFVPCSPEERVRRRLKHSATSKYVFICPRRWAPTKGIIHLANALRYLNETTRKNSLFIFAGGETPGYARYQENVRHSLAASDCQVLTMGNIRHDELAEIMSIADACIIPSLMEATSLACLEAMACATPVLGTKTGGLLELIRHGKNGWLVPPGDPKALASQLDQIAAADDLALHREAAVSTVRERYTWNIAAETTEKIYRAALQKWDRLDVPVSVQGLRK